LDVRNKVFTQGGEALALLPREAVGAPSLEVLKARLDGILGSLSWWVAALPVAWGWDRMGFKSLPTQTILQFYEINLETK